VGVMDFMLLNAILLRKMTKCADADEEFIGR